jgi:hypothetical protein
MCAGVRRVKVVPAAEVDMMMMIYRVVILMDRKIS